MENDLQKDWKDSLKSVYKGHPCINCIVRPTCCKIIKSIDWVSLGFELSDHSNQGSCVKTLWFKLEHVCNKWFSWREFRDSFMEDKEKTGGKNWGLARLIESEIIKTVFKEEGHSK